MDQRRGWCPSLWTPMESGDGLIVRLDVRARGLAPAELRALSELATRNGNGLIEITRRGRLQLRGIRAETLEPLQNALVELGLANALSSGNGSSRIVQNPLAGLHPACPPLEVLARELESALAPITLPDKFAVALDSRGVLREIGADLRANVHDDTVAVYAAEALLGHYRIDDCVQVITTLAQMFAASATARMRDLLRSRGRDALSAVIEPYACPPPSAAYRAELPSLIGAQAGWLGVGLAFGSGDPATWHALADLATRFGTGSIRITPFRTAIVVGVTGERALEDARAAGLIVAPRDPLLRAVACPGAPACSSARGETRALARDLARTLLPLLAANARLHVSGCEKGCALSGPAAITLVRDCAGARLGLGQNTAEAATAPAISLEAARIRLFELARAHESGQARPF